MKKENRIAYLEAKVIEQQATIKGLNKALKVTTHNRENDKLREEIERLKKEVLRLQEQHIEKDKEITKLKALNNSRNEFLEHLFNTEGDNSPEEYGERFDAEEFFGGTEGARKKANEDYFEGADEDFLGEGFFEEDEE